MALSGIDYNYFIYGTGDDTIVRLEVKKELTKEELQYWKTKIVEMLNRWIEQKV